MVMNALVGNAQSYHPFPTDSATWSQIMYNWGQWGQEVCGPNTMDYRVIQP